ncbi:MAG: VWA domain-containing protein [Bacteroidetes bacterium]|nr:MAG: VWA domain-containing protein [Bacteroidota bacterium]
MKFANPWLLSLLLIPLSFILWQLLRSRQLYPSLRMPALEGVRAHARPIRGWIRRYLFVLRVLAMTLFIIALARPQTSLHEEEVDAEGIDIVIAIDVSGSMLARDFQPNRLEAAKQKAIEFIQRRPNDRIGLVVFARESFTQCPLTIDHRVVQQLLMEIEKGILEDGTAIGMGLATAVIRLKESEAKSKVVILLTDGVNNSGTVDPLTAVEAAREYGIRVYTIGVGRQGMAPYPMQTPFGIRYQNVPVEIDEELLKKIATETGGKYFRATNNEALEQIYNEIDELEKSRIQVMRFTRTSEEFHWFLIIGTILLLLEVGLRYTLVRSIP